jgi:hypothetical protein
MAWWMYFRCGEASVLASAETTVRYRAEQDRREHRRTLRFVLLAGIAARMLKFVAPRNWPRYIAQNTPACRRSGHTPEAS